MQQQVNSESSKAQKKPIIEMTDKSRSKSVKFLNELLASEYTVFTKTLKFHWSVTGPRFMTLHKLLEQQYQQLLEITDSVAERIRVMDGEPMGTATEFSQTSMINEMPGKIPDSSKMLEILLFDHHRIQETIKEILNDKTTLKGDPGTEDLLVGILQKHEFTSWTLKSHLV